MKRGKLALFGLAALLGGLTFFAMIELRIHAEKLLLDRIQDRVESLVSSGASHELELFLRRVAQSEGSSLTVHVNGKVMAASGTPSDALTARADSDDDVVSTGSILRSWTLLHTATAASGRSVINTTLQTPVHAQALGALVVGVICFVGILGMTKLAGSPRH